MRPVLAIAGGWLVWAAALAGIYALHGLGCAIGADRPLVGRVTLLQAMTSAVWLAAIVVVLAALPALRRAPEQMGGMPRRIVIGGWIAALGAILVTGAPILFPSGCS